jgi:hypothetical protein
MPICPQCGQRHGLSHSLCPGCLEDERRRSGDDSPGNVTCETANLSESAPGLAVRGEYEAAENEERGAAIARFQSGAEAGYFADELTRETGIEADVLVREKFDAVHAVWTVDYILQVAPLHSQEATRALQSLVDATGDDAVEESTGRSVTDIPAGVWVPLILTLAAGSIACFGIEHLDHRPRPPALVVGDGRKPPELWEILGATNGPWVQQLEGGRGVRRLIINPDHRSAVLEEDHDGDGRIDREWEFSWRER